MFENMLDEIRAGDQRALSRAISMVENEVTGFENLLDSAHAAPTPIVGITGAPGAGKSTLTDCLLSDLVREHNNIAVICIDPSSPYTKGAILGDRIRMSQWYNHPQVFIRSLATRGALGGLPRQFENVTKLLRSAAFDIIIIETVGVGQSETEIASLADITILVLVPESGDDIQLMEAGIMEIADIYVINKSDRPGADQVAADLKRAIKDSASKKNQAVVKTSASTRSGIGELVSTIKMKLDISDAG
jgi:LAO/AO transport system kinase